MSDTKTKGVSNGRQKRLCICKQPYIVKGGLGRGVTPPEWPPFSKIDKRLVIKMMSYAPPLKMIVFIMSFFENIDSLYCKQFFMTPPQAGLVGVRQRGAAGGGFPDSHAYI